MTALPTDMLVLDAIRDEAQALMADLAQPVTWVNRRQHAEDRERLEVLLDEWLALTRVTWQDRAR